MKSFCCVAIVCFSIVSCNSNNGIDSKGEANYSDHSEEKSNFKEEALLEVCNDLKSFVRKGWKIVSQDKGDLNKDGIADIAFVLQETNSESINNNYGVIYDSNPRELIILFGKNEKDCFELSTKSKTFIVPHDNEGMEDPFEYIAISNGTLRIGFRIFYTIGSWTMGNYDYIWRFQDDEFKLIGANSSLHSREDGEGTSISANFSTNKYSLTSFNLFDEEDKEVVVWKKFDLKELKTFETFKVPWAWIINEDVSF